MLSSFLSVSMTSGPELAEEVTAIIKHSLSNVLSIVFRSTDEVLLAWFGVFISLQETFNSYPQDKVIWDNSVFLPTCYWEIHKKQLALQAVKFHTEFHIEAQCPSEFTPQFFMTCHPKQRENTAIQMIWKQAKYKAQTYILIYMLLFSSFTLEKWLSLKSGELQREQGPTALTFILHHTSRGRRTQPELPFPPRAQIVRSYFR